MESYLWLALGGAILSSLLTRQLISYQRKEGLGQPIRDYGPDIHQHKKGTPTMGGLAILIALGIAWLVLLMLGQVTDLLNLIFVTAIGCGSIGLLDDALKFLKKNSDGLAGRHKLILLTGMGFFLFWLGRTQNLFSLPLLLPFVQNTWLPSTIITGLLVILVLVGTVNAVNFNDGLDGLCVGTTLIALIGLGCVAFLQHQMAILGFIFVSMSILLGFFWWNVYPAQIFLGDAGSFALGGLIAAIAISLRVELFLPLLAFIPMLEVITVIMQVASFRLLKKRIFKVAPFHHHFERAKGVNYTFMLPNIEWPEPLITLRFWIVAALMALVGVFAYR